MYAGSGVLYRFLSGWLVVVSIGVPTARREDWVEEWRGEIWHELRRPDRTGRSSLTVTLRALGAPLDAWHVRRLHRSGGAPATSLLAEGLEDLRTAGRSLRRSPIFAVFVISLLSLGIGTNAAVFSVTRAALLGDLPVTDADRVVQIFERRPEQGRDRNEASLPDFADWRAQTTTFTAMAATQPIRVNASGGDHPESVYGASVTSDFFEVAGVPAALGRALVPADMDAGGAPPVVLGHSMWRDLFGASTDAVGGTIYFDLEPHLIVGVMPPGFSFPTAAQFWIPLALDPAEASRGSHGFYVYGRMAEGTSLERAREDLDRVTLLLESAYPETNQGHHAAAYPLRGELLGDTRASLLVMFGALGFVLLIVCVNLANLELSRALRREGDMRLRAMLGASRGRLIRQALTETAVVSGLAALASLGVAWATHEALRGTFAARLPWETTLGFDPAELGFIAVLTLAITLAIGLPRAWQGSRVGALPRLRQSSDRGGLTRSTRRWQGGLVVVQVALATVLLVGAGLLTRTMANLLTTDLGYRTADVVAADIRLPEGRYLTSADHRQFFDALEARVSALPGVEGTGLAWFMPLSGRDEGRLFLIEGRDEPSAGEELALRLRAVSPGYFDALGIPLQSGRQLADSDADGAEPVALVSETLARRYWPDRDPVGERIAFDASGPWIRIVGQVGEVRHNGPASLAVPELYLPFAQSPRASATLAMRTPMPLDQASMALRGAVSELDVDQPITRIARLSDRRSDRVRRQWELATLSGLFGAIALILASMGIYGVVTFAISRRTRELGIRLALGGRPQRVLMQAMMEGVRLVGVGVVVGLIGAVALSGALESLVVGLSAYDPISILGAAAALGLIGVLAVLVPARRAIRVSPVESLRAD